MASKAGERMPYKGWVCIYRKIRESWIWEDKPFSRGQAWIDLLMSANHEDKKTMFDGVLYEVKRGGQITSIRKLCQRWGWSNTKAKRFLNELKSDEMITYNSDTKKTAINIVNYNAYQDRSGAENVTETSQKHHRNATETSQKHTNNNDNNDNNDNIYCPNSLEFRLASYLSNWIKQNNPKAKKPNLQKWSKTFGLMMRVDKRPAGEIKQVIEWCQKDSFWYKNILSADKLRKQYDRLFLAMNERGKANGTSANNGNSEKNSGITYDFSKYGG